MSALDVIPVPGHPGMYARRGFVTAWQAAGSPPLNSAGRLYGDQKRLYDGWRAGLPGFNPADNPDDESQRLAHVRFVAGDIDPTPERVRRLAAAGLIRPYSYEPWHWELPNVRSYGIVRAIPSTAGSSTPNTPAARQEDDMPITILQRKNSDLSKSIYDVRTGKALRAISRDENTAFRTAPAGTVVYITVSDSEYTKRGGK